MKFFGLGVPELLIILAVALLIFGPKNLPKLGSALGKTVKSLRDGMGSQKDVEEEIDEEDLVEEEVEEKPAPKKTTTRKPASTSGKKRTTTKAKSDDE